MQYWYVVTPHIESSHQLSVSINSADASPL